MPFCNYCNNHFFDIDFFNNMKLTYFKIIHDHHMFRYHNYRHKYIPSKNIMCCRKCKKNKKFIKYPSPTNCYICFTTFPSRSKYLYHKCIF